MNWRRVVQSEKEYVDVYGSRVEEVLGKALTAAIEARTPVPEAFMADYLRGLPRRTTEVSTEDSEKPADTNKTVPRRLLRTPSMQAKDLGLDVRQKDSNNWFICHESMLSDPLFTALFKECGVPRKLRDQEKWRNHPNRDHSGLCDQFYVVALTEEAVDQYKYLLRMSSYRWADRKVGPPPDCLAMPANYLWFFEVVKDRKVLGWVDFISNIMIGVDATVEVMAGFYATLQTVGHWMYLDDIGRDPEHSIASMLKMALSRCWIFQETAFGSLDDIGVERVLTKLHELGEEASDEVRGAIDEFEGAKDVSSLSAEAQAGLEKLSTYIMAAEQLAVLLSRRGWQEWVAKMNDTFDEQDEKLPLMPDYGPMAQAYDNLGYLLVRRICGDDAAHTIPNDRSSEVEPWWLDAAAFKSKEAYPEEYRPAWLLHEEIMKKLLSIKNRGLPVLHVIDIFTRVQNVKASKPILRMRQLLELHATKTSAMISPPPDEMRTKTSLEHMQFAKRFGFAVVAAYCGCDVTFESDRELAITNVARHIVGTEYNIHMSPTDFMGLAWVGATASVVGSMPHLSVRQINSQIKVGLELLGLGEITGAPMFGNKYESADGTMVELPVWPNDKRYYVFLQHNEAEPGTWTGASKSYGADNDVVQVLLCNPSAAVAAAGMTKLFVIRSMKTGKVLATTCFLRNAQQKSQHWPAVAKRVALGFDSHVNYIELDHAIDKQLGWLVTRLTYPAQNLWQADGTQISKPPGGATRIWVETRENMPPHDQSNVLPPEMHAYFANALRRSKHHGEACKPLAMSADGLAFSYSEVLKVEELDVLYEHFSQPEIEWPKSRYPVEFRTTEQITAHAQSLADLIYQRCEARLPTFVVNGGAYQDRQSFDGVWTPSHINPFIRFVKGGDGGKHAAHVDGIIRKCYDEMSFLSILLYINPPEVLNFGGGHFDYLDDGKKEGTWDAAHQVARFTQQPISGGAVLFYHSIPHQGRTISVKGKQSPRYIARMDVFYKRTAPIFPKDLPGPYKGRVAPALPRNGGALVEKLLAGKSKGTEQPILLSGGSVGADTLAGAAALKAGHEVAHLYAACNEFWLSEDVRANQGGNVFLLSDELLDSAPVMAAFEKCARAQLGDAIVDGELPWYTAAAAATFDGGGAPVGMEKAKKNQPKPELDNFRSNLEWGSSRRNYLQVAAADAVYAVAARSNPDKFGPGDHTPKLDVVGGTGWACQFYIDRFEPRGTEDAAGCHLYFYDDGAAGYDGHLKDPATHRKWCKWDPAGEKWAPLPEGALPPKPTGVYAAVGMTRLNAGYGDVAFEKVMAQ